MVKYIERYSAYAKGKSFLQCLSILHGFSLGKKAGLFENLALPVRLLIENHGVVDIANVGMKLVE